jgi:6-pyruvoyltetrahydropterin/6-carboxytetrahydropterin synthase
MSGQFQIKVEASFEAAHFLRSYRGIREPLHGHSYRVEAVLYAAQGNLDQDDISVDFISARDHLAALAKRLDYGCINEIPPFMDLNPSAENVAAWFHRELTARVTSEGAVVHAITLHEGPVNSVTYTA